ncbi:BTB/POZ domain-containing protein 9 [Schistosoma japonicum]|nr:BTB/POZ domain-containing protein 9 [Schistosoma japonicum]
MSNHVVPRSGFQIDTGERESPPVYEINHSAEIIPCISQLYRNEAFSDVTLVVQNTHFPAHRAILAARSDYFRALFYGGMAESSSSVVHLNDINVVAFKCILHYIYTGQMKLTRAKLTLAILCLAHQYNFRSLENVISTYLTRSLSVKNVWSIYDLAIMYNLDGLVTACLRFLDCLAPAPLHNPRFLRLSQSSVERLLSRDSFCASEIEIFRAVCAWLRNSKEFNYKTPQILKLADIPELTTDNKNGSVENYDNNEAKQNGQSSEKEGLYTSSLIENQVFTSTSSPTQLRSPLIRDTENDNQSSPRVGCIAVTSDESRCARMMRQCVRFELMSLTELLTEVRSSKLVSSEELLDAINRQTNCPTEMPHRGWLLSGVNLASPRFGCTLIAGENGTYPHFFVEFSIDSDEFNLSKLNIESLNIKEHYNFNIDYSERNANVGNANDDNDSDSFGEEDDIDVEQDEFYLQCHQLDSDQIISPTVDMTSGQSFNHHGHVQLQGNSSSNGVVLEINRMVNNNNNPCSSLQFTNNQNWPNNSQQHIQHNNLNMTPYGGSGILSTTTTSDTTTTNLVNNTNKPARWIQPSSRKGDNQHNNKPPPPHSEYDVVRHSLNDPTANIIIRLGKPSIVNTIRMQLWDQDLRSYSYTVDVSLDQSTWNRIVDYQNYMCRSWQTLYFPSRVVQFIRITGTRNTFNRTFHLITFRCFYSETVFQQVDGFMVPTFNVANVDHGATVLEGVSRNRNALIDGNIRMYDWNSGYTCHQLGNGAIVVQLSQPFLLRSMRFLLWDLDSRTYSYSVFVSNDRVDWKLIHDASTEQCRSWQIIKFPLQLVTFIRVVGSYNTANDVFHLECPYPPGETNEGDIKTNSVEISNSTVTMISEPMSNSHEVVISPTSTVTTQHDNNNDSIHIYESHVHDSSFIDTDSGNTRFESNINDATANDPLNELISHSDRHANTLITSIQADYDLLPDLSHHSFHHA